MTEAEDRWPIPHFGAGDPKHLHAIGVIAQQFCQFESSVERLYLQHPSNSQVPYDLLQHYFYALSEAQRVQVTRKFYAGKEDEEFVRSAVSNVLDFFDWAHGERNTILHAERYPATFGDPDVLYLSKRASKRDPSTRYIAIGLKELRSVAENMRVGIVRSAELNIYVRYRSGDRSTMHQSLRPYVEDPQFPPLGIPPKIELKTTPE